MIPFVLIFMLLAGGWAAIWKLQLPFWWGGVVTAAVLLVVLVVMVVRRIAARKAATKLEGALQGEEQPKAVRPDLQPEIKAMQAEFAKAVAALKSSKLARGGRDALAVLPWYLIVGPPGSGKSTALRNSGLKFPYLSTRGSGGVRGVGGTRNCDWWLSNEAVILDTAGRYATVDDDRDEYFAFLDSVAKYRPHRPINGLIIAVSVNELLTADPQAASELGQRIRERVDQITARLRVVVPIYILITKCDLLTGFAETFSELPWSERGQIWGFTVPLEMQEEAPTELALKRFDELTSVVERKGIIRIGQERRLEARERIYQFPQQFHALRKNLSEFIQPLFTENVFQDTPILRGLYFTSATQEARAAAEQAVTGAAGVLGPDRPVQEQAEGKDFFLRDLFTQVMLPDQRVAIRSSMEELRRRKRGYLVTAACVAAALLILGLPSAAFMKNLRLVREVESAVNGMQLSRIDTPAARFEQMRPVRDKLDQLIRYGEEGHPLWMGFGMYKGDDLRPVATTFFRVALGELLVGNYVAGLQQRLKKTAKQGVITSEEYNEIYNDLKIYVLLTGPSERGEPSLAEDPRLQDWMSEKIIHPWELSGATVREDAKLFTHIYVKLLADSSVTARDDMSKQLKFERDDEAVGIARKVLNRWDRVQMHIQQLIDRTRENAFEPITASTMFGRLRQAHCDKQVEGAFTRDAIGKAEEFLKSAFTDPEVLWVLQPDNKSMPETERNRLLETYCQQYSQRWKDFLLSCRVEAPRTPDEALAMLMELSGKGSPYNSVFSTVKANVGPPTQSMGKLESLLSKAQPKPFCHEVTKDFGGLLSFAGGAAASKEGEDEEKVSKLVRSLENLGTMARAGTLLKENPNDPESAKRIDEVLGDIQFQIERQGGPSWQREILSSFLVKPFRDAKRLFTGGSLEETEKVWCTEEVDYLQRFSKVYPFAPGILQEASIAELEEFFHPKDGILARFVEQRLKEDVFFDRKWRFRPGAQERYGESLLTTLERLSAISNALFPGNVAHPEVKFRVLLQEGRRPDGAETKIANIRLTIDGVTHLYRNGVPVEKDMVWPNTAGKQGAWLSVELYTGATSEISAEGEWGLFRLLERAERIEPQPKRGKFRAVWKIEDEEVAVDFDPYLTVSPFHPSNTKSSLLEIFRISDLAQVQGLSKNSRGCQTLLAGPSSVANKPIP